MIPVVLALAFGLALVVRWWAVPMVSAGWGVLVAGPLDLGGYLGALGVAATNALVGAGLGMLAVRVARRARLTPSTPAERSSLEAPMSRGRVAIVTGAAPHTQSEREPAGVR